MVKVIFDGLFLVACAWYGVGGSGSSEGDGIGVGYGGRLMST